MLQVLFPLAFTWAVLLMFGEELSGLVPEGVLENIMILIFCVFWSAVAFYLYRQWPSFLRGPESVSLLFLLIRLVVYGPLFFVLLAGVFGISWYLLVVRPTEDPAHSQYGLSALMVAVWYSIMLTPLATIIVTWLSSLRKARRSTC
ncbi:MAG: hypothetical protein L0Y56_16385 [Nitrospira sp.]|nr:hypothetical protein [Nitrospira sp.]